MTTKNIKSMTSSEIKDQLLAEEAALDTCPNPHKVSSQRIAQTIFCLREELARRGH